MPVVVPLLRWPAHKLPGLCWAVMAFALAFLTAVLERSLCASPLGPHITAPAMCFAMCDVLFFVLAHLIDVKIWL